MKNLVVFSLFWICVCSQEAPAQTIAFYDFENGVIPSLSDYWTQFLHVRPTVLTESDGNDFLRLTVTPSDSGPNYATDHGIVRAELAMGVIDWRVHNPITISYAFRINSGLPPPDMMLGQFYQSGSNSGWTVGLAGMLSGNSMQITVKDGDHFELRNSLAGYGIPYDEWVNLTMTVYFSPNTSEGSLHVLLNGQDLGWTSGRTLKNLTDPMYFYFDLYGNSAYATVDYDNFLISATASVFPSVPASDFPSPLLSAEASAYTGGARPEVWFTQHGDLYRIYGVSHINAAAYDEDAGASLGQGIESVYFELRQGEEVVAGHLESYATYDWFLDTREFPDGYYTLIATATSTAAAGAESTTTSITVYIANNVE